MIQNWKEVGSPSKLEIVHKILMVNVAGSWPWLEEVAEIVEYILRANGLPRLDLHYFVCKNITMGIGAYSWRFETSC